MFEGLCMLYVRMYVFGMYANSITSCYLYVHMYVFFMHQCYLVLHHDPPFLGSCNRGGGSRSAFLINFKRVLQGDLGGCVFFMFFHVLGHDFVWGGGTVNLFGAIFKGKL